MQSNGYHTRYPDHPLHSPNSYDNSDYGSPTFPHSDSNSGWRSPASTNAGGGGAGAGAGAGSGAYSGFEFNTSPMDEKPDPITLNTRLRDDTRDSVGQHLLYETALLDSSTYEILDIQDIDALKKEHARLNSRLDAARRKLALESKVKDAAQNLYRLYTLNKTRPDTPQRMDSQKSTKSIFGSRDKKDHSGPHGSHRSSEGTENLLQASTELSESVKKVDDLNDTIKELLERHANVERRLLRHTAAVLAEEANNKTSSAVAGLANGHHPNSMYVADDFDGLRDILHGASPTSIGKTQEYERQMASVQERLEQLNFELRNVIDEAGRTLGKTAVAEQALDPSDDPAARLENRFVRLEDNVMALKKQQQDMRAHTARIQDSEYQNRNAVEGQLEGLNKQLHGTLLLASDTQAVPGLQEPPPANGLGYQQQLQYMEESLMTMEQLVQQHGQALQSAREARSVSPKNDEYQDTVTGLWEILQSDVESSGPFDRASPSATPVREPFTLQAFSSRVQHMFAKVQSAKEQQDILRRQIQQQRDLNGKSDAEKDGQLAELQVAHDTAVAERNHVQEQLARSMVQHQTAEDDAGQSRAELLKVAAEVDELRLAIHAKQAEHDDVSRALHEHQAHAQSLREQLAALEQAAADTAPSAEAEARLAQAQTDMTAMESEVVRLTTELTMAKADLDVAHGSRAERAGAQAAEVELLGERNREMTRELAEMTAEFQDLTKESIELEKEREQLDALIDSLRDRVDTLEGQLNDEKVKWLGFKAPSAPATIVPGVGESTDGQSAVAAAVVIPRESTSMSVLRHEFKKMVRETRAEGVRLLKAEQEERRRLETELRKIRQAKGPLAKLHARQGHSASASVAVPSSPALSSAAGTPVG